MTPGEYKSGDRVRVVEVDMRYEQPILQSRVGSVARFIAQLRGPEAQPFFVQFDDGFRAWVAAIAREVAP